VFSPALEKIKINKPFFFEPKQRNFSDIRTMSDPLNLNDKKPLNR
jgi:hypothetical protein